MSDNEKSLLFSFSYLISWLYQIVTFFIIFGIMTLLDSLFNFNQNIWLVLLLSFLIYNVHKTNKLLSKVTVEKALNEEEK